MVSRGRGRGEQRDVRKVTRGLAVLGLLLVEESREGDDLGVDPLAVAALVHVCAEIESRRCFPLSSRVPSAINGCASAMRRGMRGPVGLLGSRSRSRGGRHGGVSGRAGKTCELGETERARKRRDKGSSRCVFLAAHHPSPSPGNRHPRARPCHPELQLP